MYRKILVPLDGSATAEQILPHVKKLAKLTGAEITLMRAAVIQHNLVSNKADLEVEVVAEAEKYLKEVQQKLAAEGFNATTHVRYGHDAQEILEHAKLDGIDLVAVCSHGLTGTGLWRLGSVSRRVVHHCPKPVLVIKAE